MHPNQPMIPVTPEMDIIMAKDWLMGIIVLQRLRMKWKVRKLIFILKDPVISVEQGAIRHQCITWRTYIIFVLGIWVRIHMK